MVPALQSATGRVDIMDSTGNLSMAVSLLAVLAPSFTSAGLFFHQIYFADLKILSHYAQAAIPYAHYIIGAFIGVMVDRLASIIAPVIVTFLALPVFLGQINSPMMVWVFCMFRADTGWGLSCHHANMGRVIWHTPYRWDQGGDACAHGICISLITGWHRDYD